MTPTQEQTELVELIHDLAPDQVKTLLEFTRAMKRVGQSVHYSDVWTEEDYEDATNDSLRYLDESDSTDWSVLLPKRKEP